MSVVHTTKRNQAGSGLGVTVGIRRVTGIIMLAMLMVLGTGCASGERTIQIKHNPESDVTQYSTDWMKVYDEAVTNKARRSLDLVVRGWCEGGANCRPQLIVMILRVPGGSTLSVSRQFLRFRTEGYAKTWDASGARDQMRSLTGRAMTVRMTLDDLEHIGGEHPVEGAFGGFDFRLSQGDRAEIRAFVEAARDAVPMSKPSSAPDTSTPPSASR